MILESMNFLLPDDFRRIKLGKYKSKQGELPYFMWSPHQFEEYGVKGKVIGPIWYNEETDFGAQIIWSREHIWTEQADAALIIDSFYDPLEGSSRHDWIWFKESRVFHPGNVKIHQQAYINLDHAIESIGKEIEVPADLLRYVIVNSNLTREQKKSVGFDRPDFIEYKF